MAVACCCSAFCLKFPRGGRVSRLSALPGPFAANTASCGREDLIKMQMSVCVCVGLFTPGLLLLLCD